MSLAPGTKLEGYEVLGPLGSGGMGEVYRARDSVLKRDVAIKVLPSLASRDPDRLRRFLQEAQAAAALNHPNILAVHQFGTYEGAPYLVAELLEGDTLRQLLQRGPVAVRKAIDFCVQIAHGLAAAHETGIVHRDLKPENLFVTRQGRVKILDFGLAKLKQQSDSDTSGPTLTQVTDPGVVLGTVGYMSPEQVRGNSADHRSDIFAFGAILYEMLAGKRAFERPTSAETMTAILNEDPPTVSQIAQSTPPGLQRIVHRCLEKNPEQRFQSASDLAFALEAISESGISGPVATPAPIRRMSGKVLLWSGGIVSVAVMAAAAYYFATRKHHVPFENYSIQKTMDSEHVLRVAISPDGNYLAAVVRDTNGAQTLVLHHIPTASERTILQDAAYKYQEVVFSPDGNYIYFLIQALGTPPPDQEDLYRIPVLGGPPTRALQNIGWDSALTLTDEGHRACFYRPDSKAGTYQFVSANLDGGDEKILATGKKPFALLAGCAPDGKRAISKGFDFFGGIESVDFSTAAKEMLATATALDGQISDLRWAPDGNGIFVTRHNFDHANQIAFVSFPSGKLRPITNDLSDYSGISLTAKGEAIATTQRYFNGRFEELSLADPSHIQEHQSGDLWQFSWLDNDRIAGSDMQNRVKIVDLRKNEATALSVAEGLHHFQPALCGPDTLVVGGDGSLGKGRSI